MARFGVTYHDISNAANQIIGQGRQPTIELIRNLLGTGSTTTIANHLRKWRLEQDGSTSVAIKENLPQEFVSVMKGLWQRLQTHADNKILIMQQESEKNILYLQQEMEKYKTNNHRWQKLHGTWVKEKEELVREKINFEQVVVSLQTDNATLTTKLESMKENLLEKQQHIDELHRLHKLTQENLEHFRESTRKKNLLDHENYASQLQKMEINIKTNEQQLVCAYHDNGKLQKQLDKIIDENIELKKLNDSINNNFNKQQAAFTIVEEEYTEIKHKTGYLQEQYDLALKKLSEKNNALLEQQKKNAVILQQLELVQAEIKQLKDQNKLLTHEKWEIIQEKAQLEGINKQIQEMIRAKELI